MAARKEIEDFPKILERLQCQFLCGYALHSIDWQQLATHTSWEQQKELHDSTCGYILNQQHPIKIDYQLGFLKRLLQILEENSEEVHDLLYETYCKLQEKSTAEQAKKFAFKHYLLASYNAQFSLRESKSFVTEGTTGLCSWQASLALADFLLHAPHIVHDKTILELGAGTGLCGFILSRCCGAKHVCLTDGSLECIELMRENLLRNFKNAVALKPGYFAIQEQVISCVHLAWSLIAESHLEDHIKPNLILAADVVYDNSVLSELSQAIDFIFNMMKNKTKMLLAATIRNDKTLAEFLQLLSDLKFSTTEQEVISLEKSYLYWDRSTPVKIYLITRIL